MKKVLCIAESCCDIIFAGLPQVPALGSEIYCQEFAVKAGGGANTAISLARLGVPITMLTRIGGDTMGRVLRKDLQDAGVRLQGDLCLPATKTDVSAVLSTQVDRCFASYGAGGFCPDEALLEAQIREADIVHTYLGYCFSYPIARLCEAYGKVLSLDTSWMDTQDPGRAMELLPHCHYLKLNQVEAQRLTGEDDPEAALRVLAGQVQMAAMITLGEAGSIGMRHGQSEIFRVPAQNMGPFRDSCGAGDNFAAGVLYGLSQSQPLPVCMKLGSGLAGLSVTWLGGNDDTLNCTKIEPFFRV